MSRKKEDKQNDLKKILEDLRKEFGESSVMTLTDVPKVDVETIPTGSPSLDLALGVGGLPRGRIIEIYGPESSGKTTVALEIMAEAQKRGGNVAFIDAEHALDPEYAKRIGVVVEKLVISQPDSGEDALALAEKLIKAGAFDIIVVDSVAALTPRAELEGEMGDQFIGLQARLMSQALRKLTGIISKTRTILIFLNQTRAKIGFGFPMGAAETTPGGKALKFFSSVRIELRRIAQIKKGDQVIGSKVRAKVVKNKVAPPFKTAEFEIYYNEGISKESDLLRLGEKFGLISKQGNTYCFGETKLGVGFQDAREDLKLHSEVADDLYQHILAKVKES